MSYSLIFLSPKHLVSPLELISIQSDDEKRKPMYIHPSNLQGPSKALFFSPASGTSDCSPEDIKMLQLFEISGMLMALPIKIHSEENSRQEDSRNQELGEAPRIETETLAEALKKEVPAMEKPIDKPEPSPEEKVQAQVPRSPKKALPSTRAKQSYEGKYTQALIKEHFKTRTCLNFHYEGFCKYGDSCRFAHGEDEIRNANNYKTVECKNFLKGNCNYDISCRYLH